MFPLQLTKGTDGDDKTFEYPTAKTASDNVNAIGWNADKTSYSYTADMSNLIKSVGINLFNSYGYVPYYEGMPAVTNGAGKISIKAELNKDAYNELILMVNCILINLLSKANNLDEPWFVNVDSLDNSSKSPSKVTLGTTKNAVTNFFDGLDALVKKGATTQEKVNYVEPYARSLPFTFIKWAVRVIATDAVNVSGLWGLLQNLGPGTIQNLSELVGGILPLPFASGSIDPSINIYLDLDPKPTEYGLTNEYTMNPGVQAIEIMVNGTKNTSDSNGGAGGSSSMLYNKAKSNDMAGMKFMKDGGGATNETTTDLGWAWDFFMLRITPYSTVEKTYTTGLVQFDDSDDAESISGSAPTEIVIEDPATRTGYVVKEGQKKDFQLRDSYFFDSTLFPQKAAVTFATLDEQGKPLSSYYPASPYKDATGTQIVWDAASVDLTAATSTDSEGRRLAGYVYGYALNTVLYAIPVYVTNDFELQTLKGYYRNADGTYSAKALALDIDKMSSKYMATLPDLVRLQFASGTYTFGTTLTNATGGTAYAVINALSNASKDSNGYQLLAQPTQDEINKGATENLNVDGNKYLIYPAYVAGLVKNEDGSYKTFSVGDKTYYVLDRASLPTGKAFPTGTFSWDSADFKYDWQGSTKWANGDEANVIKVGYTYQWGLAKQVKSSIDLTAKNYKISRLTSMADANGNTVALKSERDDKGTYTTVLTIDAMSIDAQTHDLATYIKKFTEVSGKFATEGSMTNFDVEWDTSALETAIQNITKNGVINYYNGLEATIKAKVGGNRFEIATSVTKNGLTDSTSGFVGQKQTFSGKLAQEVNVKVVVSSYVYDSMVDTLTFDPYSSKTITADSFGTRFKVKVKDISGNKVEKTLTAGEGSNLKIEAPFIKVGNAYLDAYNNGIYKIGENDITFEGYKHSSDYPLYAKLNIGTEFSGMQEVYVPITVSAMTPSTLSVDVAHEDTFNPNWFKRKEHESYEVSFGGSTTHVMYPDWTSVKYYTNAACSRLKAEQNVYEGGTIYAQVSAYVLDDNGDKLGLVFNGYDDKGNAVYKMQTITLRLTVEQQSIASVNFFYDESVGDIYAMSREDRLAIADKLANKDNYTGSVYAQSHVDANGVAYGVNPVSFAQNRDNYFTVGDWGDAVNGTAVLVNLTKGTYSGKRYNADGTENPQGLYKKDVSSGKFVALTDGELGTSYIAYVQGWTTKITSADVSGIDMQTVWANIGGNNVQINVNIPNYNVTSATLKNTTLSVKNDTNGNPIGIVGGKDGNELSLVYDVKNGWTLPSSATVTTVEGANAFDTDVTWLDYSAPNRNEIASDENGKYVTRKYRFYDGLSIQTEDYVAKIYLEGFLDNVQVTLNNQATSYDVFDAFKFATTATVVANGETFDSVPVQWESTAMPTAEEIKQGAFTRKAYIMTLGTDFGVENGGWAQDFTFTINNNFTFVDKAAGFTGDFASGFGYTLTTDKFYGGLPRTAEVKVADKSIAVNMAWNKTYTTDGFAGEMTVTASNDNLTCQFNVNVNVAKAGITALASGTQFVLDPYALESTLFTSGTMQKVLVNGSESTQEVLATYALKDADATLKSEQDFYDNITKFFGKKIRLTVTYTYFGGANVMTETSEIEVYVANRTIMFVSDYEYRSIIVDTFLNTDSSYLPTELNVTTVLGGMNEHVFKAYFDWSGIDALIKSGKSDSAFVVNTIVGVENALGGYVYQDVNADGKKEYVAIDKYIEYMIEKTGNADFALTDETTYMLARQAVNVPVTVLDRTIVDAELMLDETTLQNVYSDASKYSTITDTLVGKDRNDGRYIDIVYDRTSGMPKEYVYYNHMAYIGANALPSSMKLTFANGDVGTYRLTYDNAPDASDMKNLSSTLDRTMTVHVWNTDASTEGAFEVMPAFEMKIKLRVAKVTSANSDVTYTDMSVGNYRYEFDAYADDWNSSVFNTANYASEITYYVDGQFMLAQTWWTDGRSNDGGNIVTNATYDKRHANYVVYGKEFASESQYDGVTFYTYNKSAKTYTKYVGAVNYDASTTSYKDAAGNDLYIFVYVTTQTLGATWDATGVSYGYKGGNVTVKANVASKVAGNSANANVNVVVHIDSMKNTSAKFTENDLNATTGKFYDANTETFIIDPYTSEQIFDRVTGYDGNRYEKSSTATSGYVRNNLDGTYKLEGGEYVELKGEELDRKYVNFPSTITLSFANGETKSLPITWDFSGVNVTYAGGEFTAQAIVNYEGEYDYGKKSASDDNVNRVGVQKIKVTVKVLDRSAKGAATATETAFRQLVGYVNTAKTGEGKYVNPYEYQKPTMPTTITLNVRKNVVVAGVQTDETETRTYSTIEGTADGALVWSYDEFRPDYMGGVINVIAKLIDKDGNIQEFRVPFLVKRMTASKIVANDGSYTSNVTNGIAASDFSLNPYSTSSQTMPFEYKVTFNVYDPIYDAATGTATFATTATTSTINFNYVIVSMPANTTYTVSSSGISTSADGQSATLQLGAQERITVGISQANKNVAVPSVTISNTGASLPMTYKVGSVEMRVAWFGKAEVYDISGKKVASYSVMFSSTDTLFALPKFADRKVVYTLVAAVGTVVDANGTVVTTRVATQDDVNKIGANVVSVGQTIPMYQAISGTTIIPIN